MLLYPTIYLYTLLYIYILLFNIIDYYILFTLDYTFFCYIMLLRNSSWPRANHLSRLGWAVARMNLGARDSDHRNICGERCENKGKKGDTYGNMCGGIW